MKKEDKWTSGTQVHSINNASQRWQLRLFKWISLVGRHQFLDQSHNTKPSVYWPRVTYLSDGVIDVHGRHGKFSGLWELIQTMDTSNTLLHNSLDHVKHGGVAFQHQVGGIPSIIQDLKDSFNTHEGKTCGQSINILQNHKKINYNVFIHSLFFFFYWKWQFWTLFHLVYLKIKHGVR